MILRLSIAKPTVFGKSSPGFKALGANFEPGFSLQVWEVLRYNSASPKVNKKNDRKKYVVQYFGGLVSVATSNFNNKIFE